MVSSAHVHPNQQVVWSVFGNCVVDVDVLAQSAVPVVPCFCHAVDHRLGAEEAESRIVDLDVSAPERIEFLYLLAVRSNQIMEVLVWMTFSQLVNQPE